MRPLYDRTANLVAWEDEQGNVLDPGMAWIAFVYRDNVYSAAASTWLGPKLSLSFLDRTGKPVLWSPGAAIASHIHPRLPLPPKKPIPPKTPLRPKLPLPPQASRPPLCGWSALLLDEWLAQ